MSKVDEKVIEKTSDSKLHRVWDITFVFILVYYIISCIKNISYIFNGEIDNYSKIPYILDYRVEGLIQRGLIGTIINTFDPEMSFDGRMILARIFYLIIAVLTVLVIALIVMKTPKRMRRYAAMLALLFLVSPGFSSYFGAALCRLDLYVFFIGVVCDYLIIADRAVFLVPALCGLSMIIHTGFAFLVFPIVFILLGIRTFLANETRVKYVVIFVASTLLVIGLFLFYSMVYRRIAPITAEELSNIIIEESEGKITYFDNFVHEMVFADISKEISASQAFFNDAQIISTLLNLMRCLILMVLYAFVSIKLYAKYKIETLFKRIVAGLLPLTILIIVLMYLFECDFGRWNTHLISMLFIGTIGIFDFIDIDEIEILLNSKKNKITVLMFYWILIFTVGFMGKFGILY